MRPYRLLVSAALAAIALAAVPASRAEISVSDTMDDTVAAYRKIIVLMDNASALDEGNRERVRTTAWILFEQNRDRLAKLEQDLNAGLAARNSSLLEAFLTRLETGGDYRDADKLAFRDVLDGLAATPQANLNAAQQKRLADDVAAVEKIQSLYQKEISQIFAGLQTRGMPVHREAWEHYVAFLKTKYTREEILRENASQLPPAESRGGATPKSKLEMFGTDMPEKTVALTFDDGPHPRYTDQVLAILKKYNLHAVFFEVGKNLGTVGPDNKITLDPTSAASYRILESGSMIANHSYSHPVLPKLSEAARTKEIESTNALITYILKSPPVLFRPPYGATNIDILDKVQSDKMKTVLWNVDSEDWADPVPNSVAKRVITEVEQQHRGIILFHDIHKVGLDALPVVIETLEADGYNFVSWNGSAFAAAETRGVQTEAAPSPPAAAQPYHDSWAAIIGIDDYVNWQKLQYATHDALAVRDLLIQKYNFKPDHITTLLNTQATRQNILSLLGDKLADASKVQHDDRVFVFYAGHGATRRLASGRELGYIIPVDADLTDYEGSAISMTNFQDISEAIPAKHLLFVMDSCYSGLALTRGSGMQASQNYLNEISRREARQMFTAGGADQQVADNGPNGHSVFTWTLLQGLDGRADLNGDGVITATELAAYVAPAVSALSHQTPAFGNLPGSEGGDFIFDWKHDTEFLNEDSSQLPDDGIKVNAELEKLRAQMQDEQRKNEELRKKLETAEARLKQAPGAGPQGTSAPTPNLVAPPPVSTPPDPAAAANDEGMRLYKEKRYADAAAKFMEASKLQPASALFANNAGFAFYRMGQDDQAVTWYQKAIANDPNRAIAYLNLGDAYTQLQKKAEAKAAYEKFLDLSPNSKSAPSVRQKMKSLS